MQIFRTDPKNANHYFVDNADKATSMGIELESVIRASDEIDLNLAASLLKN